MTKPTRQHSEVRFSPSQLKYLTDLFPQVVLGPHATEADMRYYFGQQSVVNTVRMKTSTSDV